MENTNSKRNNNKVKLISSLCMLLIASLMVVGSGYAWIVISTAPEVADIPVIVGANGALEIKLNLTNPAEGDRNAQFRNIIEFGQRGYDGSTNNYGLGGITLLPAIFSDSFNNGYVQIPQYGYDGLVAGELGNPLVGTYDEAEGFFYQNDTNGVRVIGTSSGVSERQLMFNNAVKEARSAISGAKSYAQNSLKNDKFMSLVIAMTGDNPTYSGEDLEVLNSMITGLERSVAKLEEAYKQLIFASAASDNGQEDTVASLVQNLWENTEASIILETIVESNGRVELSDSRSIEIDSTVLAGIEALQATKAKVEGARQDYTDLNREDDSFTSTEISPILDTLVNKDHILLNGEEISSDINVSDILSNGATITMQQGAGVYVEIADQVGDFNAAVPGSVSITMIADSEREAGYLPYALGEIEAVGAPGADLTTLPFENFYGYILDFVFKTNAENSNLLLQTEATDRVDDNNSSEETMGAGSFMQFYIPEGASITDVQVRQIMSCFNIVFFDTDTGAILGKAYLDYVAATTNADGSVTAKLYMEDEDQVITSLGQYAEEQISVLVCLDAERLENEHVSATTATSVTGILNLQFASDADLVPMPYEK